MRLVCPRVMRANRGDLLSRWGILSEIAANPEISELAVVSEKASHLPKRSPILALPCGKLYNLVPSRSGWRSLRRARAVCWTGGLDLQDDSSRIKLVHTWLVFGLYRALGLPVVALMQGAGPLDSRTGRWLARRVLALVDAFVARDSGTSEILRDLGYRGRLHRGYDGIFCGEPPVETTADEEREVERLTGSAEQRPVIGVNMRLWFHFRSGWIPYHLARRQYAGRAEKSMAQLEAAFVELLRGLRRSLDARVLLLSMYEPSVEPWEDDLTWLRRLKAQFEHDEEVVAVEADLTLAGFYSLVSRLDLMIGMRLHSALTALRAGVPGVHLSYTLKGSDIYRDLGLERYLIELEEFLLAPEATVQRAEEALEDPSLKAEIALAVDAAIERNREILADCLNELELVAA